MKAPTLAAFAPGVSVAGKMVSPTSFKKSTSAWEKVTPFVLVLQPVKKASAPNTVPPMMMATLERASLLFIIKYFLKIKL
jgi:hypothetical protein